MMGIAAETPKLIVLRRPISIPPPLELLVEPSEPEPVPDVEPEPVPDVEPDPELDPPSPAIGLPSK